MGNIIDALSNPSYRLLVGVGEPEGDGSVRVYLNARYTNLHTHIDDLDQIQKVRETWGGGSFGGHQFVQVPDSALCDCPEVTA